MAITPYPRSSMSLLLISHLNPFIFEATTGGWSIDTLFVDSKPEWLRTIKSFIYPPTLMNFLPLLNLFAPSIEHLIIKHPTCYSSGSISPFRSLRILTLVLASHRRLGRDFLTLIEAENLAVIKLKFHTKIPEEESYALKGYEWKQFCSLLLKKFPKIGKLVIWFALGKYVGQERRKEIDAIVKALFPDSCFAGNEIGVTKWGEFVVALLH
ncbi:hypothetical protein E1B28_007119 [Marasmius oreades]|uniref:Uncharacterized protein n=1 Tax=Marasmius oreades TaxID=181124 RepID=A0A9P7S2C6_9AGAR|nr:uncharacterized protein E1B28_007119 [Marasmius oreades]KAG7093441.1 hypothetical protein E1B28_007119 [Marasmius oreades]